ncbi:catalase family peroxidase [Sphingomonas sp. BN140010]|uniref:Catalase-related peroxidase n=1 Tax=Sphingomonas arvum TaxID=2992113 RepID=A0ABT3JEL4_9SPHN|nr:catalase family peroxidase [Sphingomonas sp. BN140010]MCW3797215.1 catalase family peroxidase [Sphingomonas sp. BN140010]
MSEPVRSCDRRGFMRGAGQLSLVASGAGLLGLPAQAAQPTSLENEKAEEPLAEATINALEGAYGVHPKQRRNHTKDVGALGIFTGNPEVQRWSKSRLFSGEATHVVGRFSIAGGDPKVKDSDRSPRGLALEFRIPDGSLHHMTMLNTPMFFAQVPQTFLDKFIALAVDPTTGKADPARFAAFNASHPDTRGQVKFLTDNNPPRSYSEEAYFGIHTFFVANKAGQRQKVKFHFEPRDEIHRLTDQQMNSLPDHFLEAALSERLRRGPAEWDLILTLGEPQDEEINPTLLWPSNRPKIKAGRLRLHSSASSEQAGSSKINFDPLMLSDGFEASSDPILLFRSPSYAVSHGRRLQEA